MMKKGLNKSRIIIRGFGCTRSTSKGKKYKVYEVEIYWARNLGKKGMSKIIELEIKMIV